MRFSINIEPANEGLISGIKAWAKKENDRLTANMMKGVPQKANSTQRPEVRKFPNITAAVDYLIAHSRDKNTRCSITNFGEVYDVVFSKNILSEDYRESIIRSFSNLKANLSKLQKEALGIFKDPKALNDITPKGEHSPIPKSSQEISKILPSINVNKEGIGIVYLSYYFDMEDFFDTVYDSTDEIGIYCIEGKFDKDSSWEWVN